MHFLVNLQPLGHHVPRVSVSAWANRKFVRMATRTMGLGAAGNKAVHSSKHAGTSSGATALCVTG